MDLECRILVNSAGLDAPSSPAGSKATTRPTRPPPTTARAATTRSRARALLPPDLPGARDRRPRRPRHHRHGRPMPLRPGHRMGRRGRLRCRPQAGRRLLLGRPQVLASTQGQRARARLRRRPPEDRPRRRYQHRFPDPGPRNALRPRPRPPLRHREPRPHGVGGDRRVWWPRCCGTPERRPQSSAKSACLATLDRRRFIPMHRPRCPDAGSPTFPPTAQSHPQNGRRCSSSRKPASV